MYLKLLMILCLDLFFKLKILNLSRMFCIKWVLVFVPSVKGKGAARELGS